MFESFEASKPVPSDTPPTRFHFPTLSKFFHESGTKYSDMWTYEGHSPLKKFLYSYEKYLLWFVLGENKKIPETE